MVALIHFAGLLLWFWTISPSDIDSVPALRIAGMEYPLPSLQQRAQRIASNPAAAARAFQLLINSVLCNIFGLQPAADTKKVIIDLLQSSQAAKEMLALWWSLHRILCSDGNSRQGRIAYARLPFLFSANITEQLIANESELMNKVSVCCIC